MRLLCSTSPAWLATVMQNFDAFLLDHAACERKASAAALSLVMHYPDRPVLVSSLIALAREELEHFQQVYERIAERGLTLAPDEKDAYVGRLHKEIRSSRETYLLDRLLVAGVVEARGCERLGLVAEELEPGPLRDFYRDLVRAEARHHALFVRLAREYFEEPTVFERLQQLLTVEARVVQGLPLRSAVH